MNTSDQPHPTGERLSAVRAATRLCRSGGEDFLAELAASMRSLLGFTHAVVLMNSRADHSSMATPLVPLHDCDDDVLSLINEDAEFRKIVLRDAPRVHYEFHASDVPFHPAIAPLVGRGLCQLYVFEVHATPVARTVIVCVDDKSTAMTGDSAEILEMLVSVAARILHAESMLVAAETHVHELQTALDSRVIIEQAKGALAERMKVSPDVAFQHLRQSARSARIRLPDAAASVIDTTIASAPHASQVTADSVKGGDADNTVKHGFAV